MSELEDLETNPLLLALQSKFVSRYMWVQHTGLICVPHSFSIRGLPINKEFIDAHTFQKSRRLKDNFVTNSSETPWSIIMDGNEISTAEGYPESRTVKVLGEEIGYGKVGQMFRILLIDGPLIGKGNTQRFDEDLFYQRELVWDQNMYTAFLYKFKECSNVVSRLKTDIEQFKSSYMILPGQMNDAITRLQRIYDKATSDFLGSVTRPYCSEARFRDIVCRAINCYMMNILHDKLFEVICKESSVSEGMFARQREILQKQADLLTILPTYITCDLTQSVRKFNSFMDELSAPHDMLIALKSLLDNLTTEVNKPVRRSVFDLPPPPPACLTSDDFIPLLASVILAYDGSMLNSNMYYMENFRFYQKSADCLSFSLVTLRAAYSFLMGLNLTQPRPQASFEAYFQIDSPKVPATEPSELDQLLEDSSVVAAVPETAAHEEPVLPPSSPRSRRFQEEIARDVDEILRQSNIASRELRRATSQAALPSRGSSQNMQRSESLAGRTNGTPVVTNSLSRRNQRSNPELGEFLSALREDDQPVMCGRQL